MIVFLAIAIPFLGGCSPGGGRPPAVDLTSPVAFTVIQRTGSTGNIPIAGTIAGGTATLEARFNGSAWTTVAIAVSGGFSTTLSNQHNGQGLLEVKISGSAEIADSVADVGIGDLFIIAGQSNASGRGSNNQSYSHATVKATRFGNNYLWSNLDDPSDSDSGQIDTVSSDSIAAGSLWPLLATSFMTDLSIPVAFVPCAKGGTSITAWQPGVDHQNRATLYGSMVYRALQVGGCKAVLWWQGETDALAGMSQATYNGHLDSLANAVAADLGVKLVPCKLQNCTGISAPAQAAINAAIGEAWTDNVNVVQGPDLSGITTDDEYHLQTNQKLQDAADLWWSAIEAGFYE